jgi:uncharacterized membrane protein YdbT with pleckstrin-like domain
VINARDPAIIVDFMRSLKANIQQELGSLFIFINVKPPHFLWMGAVLLSPLS